MKTLLAKANIAKLFTLGVVAGALALAAPHKAQAQVSFGVRVGVPVHGGPVYPAPYYGHRYYAPPVYGPAYGYGYGYRAPVVVGGFYGHPYDRWHHEGRPYGWR